MNGIAQPEYKNKWNEVFDEGWMKQLIKGSKPISFSLMGLWGPSIEEKRDCFVCFPAASINETKQFVWVELMKQGELPGRPPTINSSFLHQSNQLNQKSLVCWGLNEKKRLNLIGCRPIVPFHSNQLNHLISKRWMKLNESWLIPFQSLPLWNLIEFFIFSIYQIDLV